MKATSPVGDPDEETVPLSVIGEPCGMADVHGAQERFKVVVVLVKTTVFHCVASYRRSPIPNHVAKSKPTPVAQPIFVPEELVQVEVPQM